MKYCVTFFLLLQSVTLRANDSIVISKLLNRIDALQVKQDGIFPKGSFPSYRTYALNKHRSKADDNIFFTSLISFTLQNISSELSTLQQQQANSIITNIESVFPKFRNKKTSRYTYNFWPTDTPKVFPHSGWINLFNKSWSLPDDLDDTVISLMAQKKSDSIAIDVHKFMQGFTNSENKPVKNTFEEYKKIKAYSTWFGVKMPIEFDLCVHANILYFLQFYNLTWTDSDSATLNLIENSIQTDKHMNYADYISPQYARTPIILYHISRLMSLKSIPILEKLKPKLIEDTKKVLSSSNNFMDKVILSTSLLRWGVKPPEFIISDPNDLINLLEDDSFCFFIANRGSIMSDRLKKIVTRTRLGVFYYYCPAYNHLLFLENLALRKRAGFNKNE